MIGEAGDKANAAASKITRCFRKAPALFHRSTAFRNEVFHAQREVLSVAPGEEMDMTVPNETRWNGKHEVCARWRRARGESQRRWSCRCPTRRGGMARTRCV